MAQPSRLRRAAPLALAGLIALVGWRWIDTASQLKPPPGATVVPTASGPLQPEPGSGWRLGGSAASPQSVYRSYGNMIANTDDQPISVIGYRPIGAHGLVVVGVELVPYADGASAGAGMLGFPAVLRDDLKGQLLGRMPATVPPHGDDHGQSVLGRAQWLVVGYRLRDAGVRRGSLQAIELTYVVGSSHHRRRVTVPEHIALCFHVRCNPDDSP